MDAADPTLSARPEPPAARPGFGEAVLLLLVMFTASAVALAAILVGRRSAEIDIVLVGLVELLGLGLALIAGLRIARVSWRAAFLPRALPLWMLPATAVLTVATIVVTSRMEDLAARLVPVPAELQLEMARMLYAADAWDWVRVIASAAVAIPLVEELFFRGLLLRGFLLRYGRGPALVLTSLLFTLVHLNPWAMVSIFLVGLLLGWLVLQSGSLWPALLAHGVYNLSAVVMLNLALDGPPTPERVAAAVAGDAGGPLLLVGAILAGLTILGLFRTHGQRTDPW